MAEHGLFDQVKDFLLGHPDQATGTAEGVATMPAPGPDAEVTPASTPETVPNPGPDPASGRGSDQP